MAEVKKKLTQAEIEAKYSRLIDKTIKRMGDKTMPELWKTLDKLKARMQKECAREGVILES